MTKGANSAGAGTQRRIKITKRIDLAQSTRGNDNTVDPRSRSRNFDWF